MLDHFLAVLASALVFGFLGAWGFGIVTLICAVLSIGCAFYIPYHDSWKVGTSERNALKHKNIQISKARGVIAGLFATIPSFLVALFAFLCAVCDWSIGLVMNQSLSEMVYRLWFFPFSTIFQYLEQFPFLYFVPLVLMPFSAGIGYFFGRNQLMLRDYLYYRRETEKTK